MSELSDEDFDRKLSNIRHALRNPLNSILGYAEMLADDARDDGKESLAKDLDAIASSARRTADLIDTMVHRDQFVQGAEQAAPLNEPPAEVSIPEDIDVSNLALSEELYDRLRTASDNHSITDMRVVIDSIEAEGPEFAKLADHLRSLNQQYNMNAIHDILERIDHA